MSGPTRTVMVKCICRLPNGKSASGPCPLHEKTTPGASRRVTLHQNCGNLLTNDCSLNKTPISRLSILDGGGITSRTREEVKKFGRRNETSALLTCSVGAMEEERQWPNKAEFQIVIRSGAEIGRKGKFFFIQLAVDSLCLLRRPARPAQGFGLYVTLSAFE